MHDDEGTPAITYGLRGIAYLEVKVSRPVPGRPFRQLRQRLENPANVLVRMLASLTDAYGRVTSPASTTRSAS